MSLLRALEAVMLDETGGPLAEYALIAAALAMPLLAAAYGMAQAAGGALTGTGTRLTTIGTNPP